MTTIEINIGGRLRPFRFGMRALEIFCRETGLKLSEVMAKIAAIARMDALPSDLIALFYAGFKDGAASAGMQAEFVKDDFYTWLEEMSDEDRSSLWSAIAQANASGTPARTVAHTEGDEKKKLMQGSIPLPE